MKYLKRQARTLMLHIAALAVGLNAAFRATWFGRVSWDAMFPRVADPSFVPKIHEKDGGDTMVVASGGVIDFEAGTGLKVSGVDYTAALAALPPGATNVGGVAAGYTIARGVHQQAAAIDTVVTGLTTVVAVVATPRGAPTAKQSFNSASIGPGRKP